MENAIAEKDVRLFVNELFLSSTEKEFPFHNLARTSEVVMLAKGIAQYYNLGEKDLWILESAAWFSATGYIVEGRHAKKSPEVASHFLTGAGYQKEEIDAIVNAVEVANELRKPENLVEQILYDAVTYYYGTADFKLYNKLRRREFELVSAGRNVEKDWNTISLEKLEKHNFYTHYCQNLLNAAKLDNLKKMRKKREKDGLDFEEEKPGLEIEQAPKPKPEKKVAEKPEVKAVIDHLLPSDAQKNKQSQPTRGIDMMFRVSATNNVRVSIMADNKAHILITVNSIIVSVLFTLNVKNVVAHQQYLIPSIILLVVNVVTIIYSVLATRPGVSPGTFTQEQVDKKTVNMLFYGSFSSMPYEDYRDAMKKVIADNEFLYSCFIKDLYWQGRVLGRKYRLLRKAYTVFLFGLIISVASFIIAGLLF